MNRDSLMRGALWFSAALNAAGVFMFGAAAIGAETTMLPIPVPRFYAAQLAFVIANFGVAYAWLARRPQIDRPLVALGAVGKAGFFLVYALYWLAGDLPGAAVLTATPDLVLALIFAWWLAGGRGTESAAVRSPAA